jgi:pyrroline-5-carboxylate reductase
MFHKAVGCVGGGRITRILLTGFNRLGLDPPHIVVADPDESVVKRLMSQVGRLEITLGENCEAATRDVVFLAMHPPAFEAVLGEIKTALRSDAIAVSTEAHGPDG